MDPGICYIKKQFLSENESYENEKTSLKRCLDLDANSNGTTETKIQKREHPKKLKSKGMNKSRPVFKEDRSTALCKVYVNGPTNDICEFKNCVYSHNIEEYMKNKPEDISEVCYVYSVKGFCPRGLTCRFSKSHIDENFNNKKSEFFVEPSNIRSKNGLTSDLQVKLRKYSYDFSKAKSLVKVFDKNDDQAVGDHSEKDNVRDTNKLVGCIVEDEKRKCKSEKFRNKLFLSPLTTVGNLPFRRICKEYGADITCGEMACSVPLVKGLSQEWALTKRHESEDIFGVQVCGNSAQIIAQSVQLVSENVDVDFIDLNIGCPIDLIYKSGGGSALIRRTKLLETITRSCSTLLEDIPFTVKTRTGIYADKSVAHELLPKLENWGAAAITLHGRSREQRYTKLANWEYIEECAQKVNIPVIGNGDIINFLDYNEKKELAPHVSSIMIGRGALIKPWIFKEIKEQKHFDITSSDRFEILKRYTNYGLEHWGSDTRGVETTRRFLLEWLSFLYRYVPYNLIEHPPQKINQRPQKYCGRDELETLMSSPNCSDWIKISEMLLGKVPDGFQFLPKHKANSY
ncbi:tRNA-dihydrouridine(47) synthase [NAD(P)(+)]-like [Condylostylus longicornis]|uniref:tRNA-dihydrouridine(47) synthase [NAD(P)(+)]-like n=1 Tax=Condylostylus longicornis TaxID=2530218 RepID=UPI00244E2732|nr:tRNA-dihydrouridine(47) synthase [NAD(P)(+)]-like [Condylostylus longicornis]